MKQELCLGLGLLSLLSCTSMGTKVSQDAMRTLQPGVTTCAEVLERFGPPTSSTIGSHGQQQLVYTYTQSQARPENFIPYVGLFMGGANVEQTEATIDCDQAGRVQAFSSKQGQLGIGTGLISGGKQK